MPKAAAELDAPFGPATAQLAEASPSASPMQLPPEQLPLAVALASTWMFKAARRAS
jgi:hypothetical protein